MEKTLYYKTEASSFEEALPLGNGSLGAMVYGKTDTEKILINHDTLWTGKPGQFVRENAYESNEKAKALVKKGRYSEAQKEIENGFTGKYTNSYQYLGNLYLKRVCADGRVYNYSRTLDLENSIATVTYTQGDITFHREYFTSRPDDCLVIKIKASKPVSYELFGDCVGKSTVSVCHDTINLYGECPSVTGTSDKEGKYLHAVYDGDGVKVTAMARVISNGKLEMKAPVNAPSVPDRLLVSNTTEITVYFLAETSFVAFDKRPDKPTYAPCLARLDKLCERSFDEIKAAHINDVSALFNRIETDFGGEKSTLTTDERLKQKEKDLGLIELLYNFGRYLIIASSREGTMATNLQGIWNDKFPAPWNSNYTMNINTEMNYWPVLMCDLVECNYPLVELIKKLSVTGEETAKKYYRANGFVSFYCADLWGHTTPVGGRARWAYWCMASGWLVRHLFEHYEYTLDKEFLEKTAYPLMKKAAEFYLSIMEFHNGRWIVTPSTSPENACMIDGEAISVFPYTAISQGIVEDLFTCILKSAEALNIDDDFTREVKQKLPYVNVYEIGSCGQLLEYDKEYEEEDVHHRHVSHLYGLYPANLISTEKTPELAEACRVSLERRGDDGTGWSIGWKVNLWAKLKDGNRAMALVKRQLTFVPSSANTIKVTGGGTYANMFDAHPPFQIDGNLGATAGITQMLLQCEDDKIRILPALPDEMKNGKIKGLLAKGNIKVNIYWKDLKLYRLELCSRTAQTVTLTIDGKDRVVSLMPNAPVIIQQTK